MTHKFLASLILGLVIVGSTTQAMADMVRLVDKTLPPVTINSNQR